MKRICPYVRICCISLTLFSIFFITSIRDSSYALSNEEYKQFMSESKEYRDAENRLSGIWKQLMEKLDETGKAELKKSQRNWVKHERDSNAKIISGQRGISLVSAYALVTEQRADILEQLLPSVKADQTANSRGSAIENRMNSVRKEVEKLQQDFETAKREKNKALKRNISGEYANEVGTVNVKELPVGKIEFSISVAKGGESGCVGELEKQILPLKDNRAVLDIEGCKLSLTFTGNTVEVSEDDCSMYYGMNCFFDGTYVLKSSPAELKDNKKNEESVSIGEKINSMFDFLPPAPLTVEASREIGTAMFQVTQGIRKKPEGPEELRKMMVESFKMSGYSFYKTVENVAKNPIQAYRDGGWTGFILATVADLNDDQIRKIYTENEAEAILKLRRAMESLEKR